jgi:hypothetical protein
MYFRIYYSQSSTMYFDKSMCSTAVAEPKLPDKHDATNKLSVPARYLLDI